MSTDCDIRNLLLLTIYSCTPTICSEETEGQISEIVHSRNLLFEAAIQAAINALFSSYPSTRRIISIRELIRAVMTGRFSAEEIACSAAAADSVRASNPYPPQAPRSW